MWLIVNANGHLHTMKHILAVSSWSVLTYQQRSSVIGEVFQQSRVNFPFS